jgi:hypothetical protein
MEELRTFVKPPAGVKEVKKVRAFVEFVRKDLEGLSPAQRKEMKLDIISYVASLAELYFGPQTGPTKKKAVLEAVAGTDELHNLEDILKLVLETGRVVRKTTWKRLYLWFKKSLKAVARM